jgi:hypothetical protein
MRKIITFSLLLISFTANSSVYWQSGIYIGSNPSSVCSQYVANTSGWESFTLILVGDGSVTQQCDILTDNNYHNYKFVNKVDGVCPSSLVDDGSGQCVDPSSCPAGQLDFGSGCEDICSTVQADGETPRNNVFFNYPMGEGHALITDDTLGCEYEHVAVTACHGDLTNVICTHEYKETGNYLGISGLTNTANQTPELSTEEQNE